MSSNSNAIVYQPRVSQTIESVAHEMTIMANNNGKPVAALFNNIELSAVPGDNPQSIVDTYHRELERIDAETEIRRREDQIRRNKNWF